MISRHCLPFPSGDPALQWPCPSAHAQCLQTAPSSTVANFNASGDDVGESSRDRLPFLNDITHVDQYPKNNDYNTKLIWVVGTVSSPIQTIWWQLWSKLSECQTLGTGHVVTMLTVVQQLYKVVVDIVWVYPDRFQNFIPRLGGMHMLMSFIGSMGTRMNNSGLEENNIWWGTKKLSGKKSPNNLWTLRMVVEELFRDIVWKRGLIWKLTL